MPVRQYRVETWCAKNRTADYRWVGAYTAADAIVQVQQDIRNFSPPHTVEHVWPAPELKAKKKPARKRGKK